MQAIILAGGKGTRMGDLTKELPKPLLQIDGKNLIEWKLEALPAEVDDVIIVVSYQKEKIQAAFSDVYNAKSGPKRIRFVDQGVPKGTAHALWAARDLITGPFLSVMGDDIYSAEDMALVSREPGWAMTVTPAMSFPDVLDIVPDEKGFLKEIVFDHHGTHGKILLDICLYKFGPELFDAPLVALETKKEEYGLPQTAIPYVLAKKIPMKIIQSHSWYKINSPEDAKLATQAIVKKVLA